MAQDRFRQQNFAAGFRSPDSSDPVPAESPLSLSLSISLTSHFLSPVLDFFDRGILCQQISMSSDSGMVMGMKEKL